MFRSPPEDDDWYPDCPYCADKGCKECLPRWKSIDTLYKEAADMRRRFPVEVKIPNKNIG